MIHAFLRSLEDPHKPLFGPNYWVLNKIGLLLPENSIQRLFKIIIHEIVTFFVVTQYMELYVIRSDLDLVLTNLKISMLSIVCVIKANTFVFWQNNWRQVIDYITDADNFERANQDSAKGRIINSYTKYCRRVTYFYWGLVFTTFITVITTPLMKYYSSQKFRESFRNGTEAFPHIFSAWMPIDKEHSPGCWITVLWHIGLCAYGATIMAAYDTSVMVFLVFFGGKLDLLRIRCREMLGTCGQGISDEAANSAVRELHQIHILLLKHSRLFNSVLSPVMFFYVVMCSLMICASAFQLTSATNTTQKLLMAEYLIFGIAQLFMFCWHSNDVIYKSQEVTLGPYESKWWAAGIQQRNSILLLQGQMQIVHIYTAGPFTNLTLSTFVAFEASEGGTISVIEKKMANTNAMKTHILWPPNVKGSKSLDRVLKRSDAPDETWITYGVQRFFYETNNLEKAKKKLVALETTSDIQTEEENDAVNKKRKRQRNKKFGSGR